MKKAFLAMIMALVVAFTVIPISASATVTWLAVPSEYKDCCTATLSKPGKKDATVQVQLTAPQGANRNISIMMKDDKNRVIWSEKSTLSNAKTKTSWFGVVSTRVYTLGKNHSVYKLYFKLPNYAGNLTVSKPKNCSIK